MKWMMMILFFFYNTDKAFAQDSILEIDSPYIILKDLHVFSLRIPPRIMYSAEWKTEVDTNDPQLCQIGVETHREKQNVYSHCDLLRNKNDKPADFATTTDMEDL